MFGNQRLERKIDAANAKLDLILDHLGIQDVPPAARELTALVKGLDSATVAAGMAEVDALLLEGKKIQAIKRYREITGSGLAAAKHAVESRERAY